MPTCQAAPLIYFNHHTYIDQTLNSHHYLSRLWQLSIIAWQVQLFTSQIITDFWNLFLILAANSSAIISVGNAGIRTTATHKPWQSFVIPDCIFQLKSNITTEIALHIQNSLGRQDPKWLLNMSTAWKYSIIIVLLISLHAPLDTCSCY